MEPVKDTTKTLGEVVEGILDKAPIYNDAIQPTAQALGKGFGGLILWFMQPFIHLGLNAKENISRFEKGAEERLSMIPKENLISPDPIISGPMLQSLGYTIHHKHLRSMFTNLLITASDNRMAALAHPAFVEIIKQLSPDEALILKYISREEFYALPIINLNRKIETGYQVVASKYNLLPEKAGCQSNESHKKAIDNLERLKIISVDVGESSLRLETDAEYQETIDRVLSDFSIESVDNLKLRPISDLNPGRHFIGKGIVQITAFGEDFLKTCVKHEES